MIRRAESKDLNGVKKLLFQVNQVHADGRPDLFKSGGIKYTDEDLLKIFSDDNMPWYIYTDDSDEVLGYCLGIYKVTEENTSLKYRKEFFIDDLCVDEKARGKHIGTELYTFVKQVAKENGCTSVTLHVWALNTAARAFYDHLGMMPLNTTMEEVL